MSNQANLADLIKIEELNQQIISLTKNYEDLESQIATLNSQHPTQIESHIKQIKEEMIQKINLEASGQAIKESHVKELEYKKELASLISASLDKILSPDFYSNLLKKIIAKVEANKADYSILYSSENSQAVKGLKNTEEVKGKDILQLTSENKIYILNNQETKTYLLNQLINTTTESLNK